jgi:hypothetical protein
LVANLLRSITSTLFYQQCYRCGDAEYTGGTATKAHGDGSWGSGTCPDCGTHTWTIAGYEASHPHKEIQACYCGASGYTGNYYSGHYPDCDSCSSSVSTTDSGTVGYLCNYNDVFLPLAGRFSTRVTIEYSKVFTNTTVRYAQIWGVVSDWAGQSLGVGIDVPPPIYMLYSSNGTSLGAQPLTIDTEPVLGDPSWYKYASSISRSRITFTVSPLTATGNISFVCPSAHYPTINKSYDVNF